MLEYMAGFFDGEGSISIVHSRHKDGRNTFQVLVQISNINKKILDLYKEAFGGQVYEVKTKKSNHRQAYYWKVVSRDANKFLRAIYPYLKLKFLQAELAIEFQELIDVTKKQARGKKLNKKQIEFRKEYQNNMKRLNNS